MRKQTEASCKLPRFEPRRRLPYAHLLLPVIAFGITAIAAEPDSKAAPIEQSIPVAAGPVENTEATTSGEAAAESCANWSPEGQWEGQYELPEVQATTASYEVAANGSMTMQVHFSPLEDYRYEIEPADWDELAVTFLKDDKVICQLERKKATDDLKGTCEEKREEGNQTVVLYISMRQLGASTGEDEDCDN